jgi:hypothetical protein
MARPKKQIDKKTFEGLCGIQCTQEEICSVLDVSTDTLDRWCQREYGCHFSEVFKNKRNVGKMSLRRTQFRLAEKSSGMAIWLGKQYLDQVDRFETKTIVEDDADALSRAFERLVNGEDTADN